jgi:hypothetical protein
MDTNLEQVAVRKTATTVDLRLSPTTKRSKKGGTSPPIEIKDPFKLAANPSTSPEVLSKLAEDASGEVRRLLASNPNTPTDVLWQLGIDFPEAILDNPVFALLQIEHLNLAAEIPACTLTSLLQCEQVPPEFLDYALSQQDYSLWLAVAYNHVTPQRLLKNLAQKSRRQDRELIRAVAAHPNTPPDLLADIIEISSNVAQIVAENPHTSIAALIKLLRIYRHDYDTDSVFVTLVALHPQVTAQHSIEMCLVPNESAAQTLWLAKQVTTDSDQLVAMSRTEWDILRLAIVRHPHTPGAVVEEIWNQMRSKYTTESDADRLVYDSFVCNDHISDRTRTELRKLLRW